MVEVAALVGDTARATMLSALMGGQALTASELAARARISKSTASGHLTKLVGARLLAVTQKRRNRYYREARRSQPSAAKSAWLPPISASNEATLSLLSRRQIAPSRQRPEYDNRPERVEQVRKRFDMRERVTRNGWKADIWPCLSGRQGCAESRHFRAAESEAISGRVSRGRLDFLSRLFDQPIAKPSNRGLLHGLSCCDRIIRELQRPVPRQRLYQTL